MDVESQQTLDEVVDRAKVAMFQVLMDTLAEFKKDWDGTTVTITIKCPSKGTSSTS